MASWVVWDIGKVSRVSHGFVWEHFGVCGLGRGEEI